MAHVLVKNSTGDEVIELIDWLQPLTGTDLKRIILETAGSTNAVMKSSQIKLLLGDRTLANEELVPTGTVDAPTLLMMDSMLQIFTAKTLRSLGVIEARLLSNFRCLEHSNERSVRSRALQDNHDLIKIHLTRACNYPLETKAPEISKDLECCEFRSVARWGIDRYEQNERYTYGDHLTLVQDRPRVDAFIEVLDKVALGRHVLDVGSGSFCLLSRLAIHAGAKSVDTVEQNGSAVEHAIDLFFRETCGREQKALRLVGASLVGHDLCAKQHRHQEGMLRLSLSYNKTSESESQSLRLFEGFSTQVPLAGAYNLVVHEILGHIASSEGAVDVILDLQRRKLLTHDCIFVPRRAVTLFAPTEQIQLTCLERILHLNANRSGTGILSLTKYHVKRFPKHMTLATAAVFEDLDFAGDLQAQQRRVVEFFTDRSGVFDGLHFHIIVEMDANTVINTLLQQTTWHTTYVRLLDPGIFLPANSRIVCRTWVELDCTKPHYSIDVAVGEEGNEQEVARYSWTGCS
eukprot:gnl/MRDRNA2_/MRDRNA2_85131_c1_seq6.p1 gnl/MRDRNA2_/MRDRNA2_85131_c1~~gnl/MRDRNA2_/MRDRNA2_85131_c1_seq6.p1  ORF type:complete len:518 (+),score=85.28 gnl/MRDRNA2_/MRDRNA2_85131_c1_seq6:1-1554(+)